MQISVVSCFFLEETLRKLADTGDQRFVIGDAIGGCGGLRVASTLRLPHSRQRRRLTKAAIGVVGDTANRDSISGVNALKWPHRRH
jgi:hypothetical protein